MSPHDHNTRLSSLERQRAHLESTLVDLQNSLYHWRTWEAEYDGLKSVLSAPRDDDDDDVVAHGDGDGDGSQRRDETTDEDGDMLAAALEYISAPDTSTGSGGGVGSDGGATSVLTAFEVADIIYGTHQRHNNSDNVHTGDGGGGRRGAGPQKQTRSRAQILSLLDRRIDYVRENERVLEQRVERAQRNLDEVVDGGYIEGNGGRGEEGGGGLPVTEIVEELDEAGSVVRGDTVRAGESAMELLDVLKRAGVKEVDDGGGGRITEDGDVDEVKNEVPNTTTSTLTDPDTTTAASGSDVMSNDVSLSNISTNGSTRPSLEAEKPADSRDTSKEQNGVVTEVDESPEDAALRREMLQYGLEEVGAVVAELELDDSGSEASVDDDEEKELYDYIMGGGEDDDDEEGEDEDEYGRTTRRMIGDDYHRQMLELERKLNAKGLQNIGPDFSSLPAEVREEMDGVEVSSAKVELGRGSDGGKKKAKKTKKRVAFADDVDIAPDSSSAVPPVESQKQKNVESPEVPPIQEQVIERAQSDRASGDVSEAAKPAKKASRFRSARQAQEPTPIPTPASASTTIQPQQQQQQPPQLQIRGPTQGNNIPLFPATPSEPKPFSQPIIYPDDSSSSTTNTASSTSPSKRQIVSDALVERPPSSNSPAAADVPNAPDPDDFDEAMLSREVKMEYYRMRNRKIQQQGGFVRSPEEDEEEHDEDTFGPIDDGRKKVSRFKAARVRNNAFS